MADPVRQRPRAEADRDPEQRHKDDDRADSSSFTAAEYFSKKKKKYSAAKEFRVSNSFHRESDHGLFAPSAWFMCLECHQGGY